MDSKATDHLVSSPPFASIVRKFWFLGNHHRLPNVWVHIHKFSLAILLAIHGETIFWNEFGLVAKSIHGASLHTISIAYLRAWIQVLHDLKRSLQKSILGMRMQDKITDLFNRASSQVMRCRTEHAAVWKVKGPVHVLNGFVDSKCSCIALPPRHTLL